MFPSILFPVWFQGRAGEERMHKSFGKQKGSSNHGILKVSARRVPSFTSTQWTGSPFHSSWILSFSSSHYISWVYSSAVKDASFVHSCNFEVNERQTVGLSSLFSWVPVGPSLNKPLLHAQSQIPLMGFYSEPPYWVCPDRLLVSFTSWSRFLHNPHPSPFST